MPQPIVQFPIDRLAVRPWSDPVIDEVGHDPRSAYVERFWLAILGPSATWLLRRIAAGLEAEPAGFDLDVPDTAGALGLGRRGGKGGPFLRAVERCCYYGSAQHLDETTIRVRRKLPPLTRSQVTRLPDPLQAEHERWISTATRPAAGVEQLRHRSRKLALSLLELGEDVESTERQLHRWRFHPALARESTAWALARHRAATDTAGSESSPGAA